MPSEDERFERVRQGIFHKTVGHDDLDVPADAALDALASIEAELADAWASQHRWHGATLDLRRERDELRAELTEAREVLKHIATWQPESQSDAEVVMLLRDQAAQALQRTETPTPSQETERP